MNVHNVYQYVEYDDESAMEWYMKAAALDYDQAMWHIFICYYDGRRVPQDMNIAYQWLFLFSIRHNVVMIWVLNRLTKAALAEKRLSDMYIDGIHGRLAIDVKASDDWIFENHPYKQSLYNYACIVAFCNQFDD